MVTVRTKILKDPEDLKLNKKAFLKEVWTQHLVSKSQSCKDRVWVSPDIGPEILVKCVCLSFPQGKTLKQPVIE